MREVENKKGQDKMKKKGRDRVRKKDRVSVKTKTGQVQDN